MKHPLSDTDENLKRIEAAAEKGVSRAIGNGAVNGVQNPRTSESVETRLAVAEHYNSCWNEGAGHRIWEEIEEIRKIMKTSEIEQTKLLAVIGFWKWALPVVAAAVGAGAAIAALAIRMRHGG